MLGPRCRGRFAASASAGLKKVACILLVVLLAPNPPSPRIGVVGACSVTFWVAGPLVEPMFDPWAGLGQGKNALKSPRACETVSGFAGARA